MSGESKGSTYGVLRDALRGLVTGDKDVPVWDFIVNGGGDELGRLAMLEGRLLQQAPPQRTLSPVRRAGPASEVVRARQSGDADREQPGRPGGVAGHAAAAGRSGGFSRVWLAMPSWARDTHDPADLAVHVVERGRLRVLPLAELVALRIRVRETDEGTAAEELLRATLALVPKKRIVSYATAFASFATNVALCAVALALYFSLTAAPVLARPFVAGGLSSGWVLVAMRCKLQTASLPLGVWFTGLGAILMQLARWLLADIGPERGEAYAAPALLVLSLLPSAVLCAVLLDGDGGHPGLCLSSEAREKYRRSWMHERVDGWRDVHAYDRIEAGVAFAELERERRKIATGARSRTRPSAFSGGGGHVEAQRDATNFRGLLGLLGFKRAHGRASRLLSLPLLAASPLDTTLSFDFPQEDLGCLLLLRSRICQVPRWRHLIVASWCAPPWGEAMLAMLLPAPLYNAPALRAVLRVALDVLFPSLVWTVVIAGGVLAAGAAGTLAMGLVAKSSWHPLLAGTARDVVSSLPDGARKFVHVGVDFFVTDPSDETHRVIEAVGICCAAAVASLELARQYATSKLRPLSLAIRSIAKQASDGHGLRAAALAAAGRAGRLTGALLDGPLQRYLEPAHRALQRARHDAHAWLHVRLFLREERRRRRLAGAAFAEEKVAAARVGYVAVVRSEAALRKEMARPRPLLSPETLRDIHRRQRQAREPAPEKGGLLAAQNGADPRNRAASMAEAGDSGDERPAADGDGPDLSHHLERSGFQSALGVRRALLLDSDDESA